MRMNSLSTCALCIKTMTLVYGEFVSTVFSPHSMLFYMHYIDYVTVSFCMNVYNIIGAEDLEPPAKKAKMESVSGIAILTHCLRLCHIKF